MSFKIKLLSGLFLLVATLGLSSGERARYDNYRIYRVKADNATELDFLKKLDGASDSLMFLDNVHLISKPVHIVVAPHKVPDFLEIMATHEIEYELKERDLQSILDSAEIRIATRADAYGWDSYYTLEDTYKWMQSLAKQYPGVVTLIEAGKTYQQRSILGVKISFKNGKSEKAGIFLEAGIHAREWIAPATATYIINQLLTSQDASVKNIATNYDWYIFPHTNPDGYVHTHTTDRMWRKTRAPFGACFGVDPNRNWGFHWNEIGTSNEPCSDNYSGPGPFSEIETRSLSNYIASLEGKIQLYISFHSFSQLLMYPYGFTNALPENVKDLDQVFKVATAAITKRYGTQYTGGNIYDAIYPAAGSSIDWAYADVGIKMAFCYELRPNSQPGHQLPATQIKPTGEETLDSIAAMVGEVQKLGYFDLL